MRTNNKLEDQLDVLEMLSALLTIGFPLSSSLDIMATKFEIKTWKKELERGVTFYDLLAKEKYDKDVLLVIKLGLDSENFQSTIVKAIEIINSKIEKRNELIEIVKYPIMLLVIAILSLGFVTFFLLPQFEKILSSVEATSEATKYLYLLFDYGPYVLIALVITLLLSSIVVYKLNYEQRLKLLIGFKPIRSVYVSLYNQVFAVTLVNLLKTNLHLSTIIYVLSNQTENKLLASEAKKIETGLKSGKYISESISPIYYDKQLIHILKLGEESGMLLYYLDSYSKIISTINQNRGKKLVFWIQPIFYATFGILILLLYAAIFIPMFTLMDSI